MRYLVGFVLAAALVASPVSADAQEVEEGAALQPKAEEAAPPSKPVPEERALQLKLDEAGVEVDGYMVASEEMELRKRESKARAWLIATAAVTAAGVPLLAVGVTVVRRQGDVAGLYLATVGGAMVLVGVPGMVASGAALGASRRKLRQLHQTHYGTPRRVQWDVAPSRLVF